MSTGPNFEVATGDPAQISMAAAVHQDVADALELHEATVRGTAGELFGEWDGEAANSYQTLSEDMSIAYLEAAGVARMSASALSKFSTTLEQCQKAGAQALRETEYWLEQQVLWEGKLASAKTAITQAQAAITSAQGQTGGRFGFMGAMDEANARQALANAQTDAQTATRKLATAKEQVILWEARGRFAWDEAIAAAQHASGIIGSLDITPPPLAGWNVNTPLPIPPPAKKHGGGGFWGFVEKGLEWSVLASNPIGQGMLAMHYASDWSGKTIGVCVGGSASYTPVGGTASVCYDATPNGGEGFTETLGGGATAGDSVSGFVGPMISNGQKISDQGSWFQYVSGGGGVGPYGAGGSYVWGNNSQGTHIHDYSFGWEPTTPGASLSYGKSYTWTQGLPDLP
jgi:hypothetical protein